MDINEKCGRCEGTVAEHTDYDDAGLKFHRKYCLNCGRDQRGIAPNYNITPPGTGKGRNEVFTLDAVSE